MSLYPCALHGTRVRGSLETAYPTLLRGGARYSRHLRLCPDHMDEVLGSERLGLAKVGDDDSDLSPVVCSACGQEGIERSALDPFFVTIYRRGEDQADYYATLCGACGDGAISYLGLGL